MDKDSPSPTLSNPPSGESLLKVADVSGSDTEQSGRTENAEPLLKKEDKVSMTASLDEKQSRLIDVMRLLSLIILGYVLIGTIIYPSWWYLFFFRGGIFSTSHWEWGWDYLRYNFLGLILAGTIILVIAYIWIPSHLRQKLGTAFDVLRTYLYGRAGLYLQVFLVASFIISLWTLDSRSKDERARLQEHEIERQKVIGESLRPTTGKIPLTEPTSFMYLSKDSIESLYGQYEPDLIPSSVIEEIKNSTEFKAGINVQEFLKTEAGKNELQRKLTEYRQAPKNTERKLKDLLKYLFERNAVKRYGSVRATSEDIRRLDDAVELLKSKYSIPIDIKQLTVVRDRLLSQEMQRLGTELKDLKGLVLVEGDWLVDVQTDSYTFRRPFIENVTDPPICETKLRKSDVSQQYKDVIERQKGTPIRLSIFGNVITGLSGTSRLVHLNSIAVF